MTSRLEDFTGAAGVLTTGYTGLYGGAISRDGAGLGTGTGGEERGVLDTSQTYGTDQEASWLIKSVSGSVQGGVVRGSGSGATWSGYRGYIYSIGSWGIDRVDNGSSTSLASGGASSEYAIDQAIKFKVVGTVLTLERGGSPIGSYDTAPDATKYSSGAPGFYTYADPLFDDVLFADIGGDTTAPVLSSPTGTSTGSTTATVGATTDEGNGTLYAVVTTSATQPSVAQIKAGQDHTGAAAPWAGSQAVSSTGAKTLNATGLSASTAYYGHLVHADAAANDSNVVSSAEFTTSAPPPAAGRIRAGIFW